MRRLPTLATTLAVSLPLIVLGVPAHAAAPTCAGERATVVGNAKANTVTGTARRDVIWAGDGNDTIGRTGSRAWAATTRSSARTATT